MHKKNHHSTKAHRHTHTHSERWFKVTKREKVSTDKEPLECIWWEVQELDGYHHWLLEELEQRTNDISSKINRRSTNFYSSFVNARQLNTLDDHDRMEWPWSNTAKEKQTFRVADRHRKTMRSEYSSWKPENKNSNDKIDVFISVARGWWDGTCAFWNKSCQLVEKASNTDRLRGADI